MDVKRLMVPWLEGAEHVVYEQIDMAWHDRDLIRMMANEAPIPPSRKVIKAIVRGARVAHRYPDSLNELRKRIGELNGNLGPEWVVLGNGSNEVLDMIFRSFAGPGDELIQSVPCYGFYQQRAELLGAKTISIPSKKNWDYDVRGIENAVTHKTKMVILANPNNPTGNLIEDSVYEQLARLPVILVCDEAYIEFSGFEKSKVPLMKRHPNMVIVRTLSKAYGLAGMRLGYSLAHPETIEIISKVQMPWNVNLMCVFGAQAALDDLKALSKRVRLNNEGRDYLEKEMSRIEGLSVYHSHGNYILFDASETSLTSDEIVEGIMQKYGIILRKMHPVNGHQGLFRITIGSRRDNERCVHALKNFFGNRKTANRTEPAVTRGEKLRSMS